MFGNFPDGMNLYYQNNTNAHKRVQQVHQIYADGVVVSKSNAEISALRAYKGKWEWDSGEYILCIAATNLVSGVRAPKKKKTRKE